MSAQQEQMQKVPTDDRDEPVDADMAGEQTAETSSQNQNIGSKKPIILNKGKRTAKLAMTPLKAGTTTRSQRSKQQVAEALLQDTTQHVPLPTPPIAVDKAWLQSMFEGSQKAMSAQMAQQQQDMTAQMQQLRDDLQIEILPKILEQKARLDDHTVRIQRLEQEAKDENWRIDKMTNVKVSMTGKASAHQFLLDRSLTDVQRNQKLKAMVNWVTNECEIPLFEPQCYIVVPRSQTSKPFYILKCTSAVHARFLRVSKWQKFRDVGLFVGEDLTVNEQSNLTQIRTIMQTYWSVAFIPSTRFVRDKLKCTIDGNAKTVLLTLSEVEQHVQTQRIDSYVPKNVASGSS